MIKMHPSYPKNYGYPFPQVPFAPPPPSPALHDQPPLSLQYGPSPPAGSNDVRERIYFQNVIPPTILPTHETEWSTSLFGCFGGDPDPCILTALCPCVVSGQISEIVNEGKTCKLIIKKMFSGRGGVDENLVPRVKLHAACVEGTLLCLIFNTLCCCTCIYTCHTRSKMRRKYMLKGTNSSDFMTHLYCMYCALCQEYRELYRLGFDPAIGWFENMERDRRAVAVFKVTPPAVQEGMQR